MRQKATVKRLLSERKTSLSAFERIIGLSFRKKSLLLASLAHPSYRHETPKLDLEDFERMEFLGDAVLNFVVSEALYQRFPEADEGLLSQQRSVLVSKKILARTAVRIGLPSYLLVGRSEKKRPQREKEKIFADSMEAVIAAVFFDRGLDRATQVIRRLFKRYLAAGYLTRLKMSPKNLLQEWVQKNFKTLPQYQCEMKDGHFVVWAYVPHKGRAKAEGHNKKEAEEKAARLLLALLKKKSV